MLIDVNVLSSRILQDFVSSKLKDLDGQDLTNVLLVSYRT